MQEKLEEVSTGPECGGPEAVTTPSPILLVVIHLVEDLPPRYLRQELELVVGSGDRRVKPPVECSHEERRWFLEIPEPHDLGRSMNMRRGYGGQELGGWRTWGHGDGVNDGRVR